MKKSVLLVLLVTLAGLIAFLAFGKFGEEPAAGPATNEKPSESFAPPADDRPIAAAEAPRADPSRKEVKSTGAIGQGGVEGIVTNVEGQPVAGARVELVKAPLLSPIAANLQGRPDPSKVVESKVYSTSSGPDGRYRLAAPPAENWRLTASHPDYARVEYQNVATLPDSYLTFSIQLKQGIMVYGRVTEDQKNMPVVGAVVSLDDPGVAISFPTSIDEKRECVTDASGQFRFHNVKPGRHSLAVRAQTYGSRNFPVLSVPENESTFRHDVRLSPGKGISGRVVDANGNFVPNARVSAVTAGLAVSTGTAVTNQLGEFVVTDLEEGRYFLSADAGDLGQGKTDVKNPIQAGSVDVEIRLEARAGVQGFVRDRLTGQPISKFTIEVRFAAPGARAFPREAGPFPFHDRRDGSFEVGGVGVQGEHVLYVTADGYAPGYSERFSVQEGQVTRGVDVRLSIGGTIAGRLVDARTNEPVVGASVRTRDNEWTDMSGIPFLSTLQEAMPQKTADRTVLTDSDGRFEFHHMGEGVVQLHITHPQYVTLQHKNVAVNEGVKTDVGSLKMSSGCVVKGTVYTPDGAPAANAEVRIQSRAQIGSPGQGILAKTIRTDAQGKYVIRNLPPGDYQISATPGSLGSENVFGRIAEGRNTRREITLTDGSEQDIPIFLTSK